MNEELSNLKKELKLIERISNFQHKLLMEMMSEKKSQRLIVLIIDKLNNAKDEYITFLRERAKANGRAYEEKLNEIKKRYKN